MPKGREVRAKVDLCSNIFLFLNAFLLLFSIFNVFLFLFSNLGNDKRVRICNYKIVMLELSNPPLSGSE